MRTHHLPPVGKQHIQQIRELFEVPYLPIPNVLVIYCMSLTMTQINRYTNPGVSSGAFSYPAGFSHTNLKISGQVYYSCQT